MRVLFKKAVFLAPAFLLCACASRPPPAPPKVATDPALAKISESASEIQKSWNTLASISEYNNPPYTRFLDDYNPKDYPASLKKKVTVKWSGPIGPLVQMLARDANLSTSVVGNPPPTPVLVYINAKNKMIGSVLRNVGYQAGNRAGVRVIPNDGGERVELVYVHH